MTLKDLNLKVSYDSDEDNILDEFYVPALCESISYKRLAGFFTSSSLAIAAKGLAKFIYNQGKIQLIANVVLSKEDYEKIKEITEKPFLKKAETEFIESLDRIEDELIKDHVKMLGWMLKNNKLEIKISLIPEGIGIQHQKTGILEDGEGNIISFSGSDNETKMGWIDNVENFHVFCNWKEDDIEHINSDLKRFEKFWDDKAKRARIFSVSEAVNNKLIRIAPKTDGEFKRLSKEVSEELLKRRKNKVENIKQKEIINLFYYQKEAINSWIKNKYSGVFEMATGTGKTFTALGCLKEISNIKEKLVSVIVCPYNHLIKQWVNSIINFDIDTDFILADGSNRKWKDQLTDYLLDIEIGRKKKLIILTTYNTFSTDFFKGVIENVKDMFIIADEMHWSGAEKFKEGLTNNYKYRLGLSATPNRYFDDEGSKFIINYFGDVVYTFDLKKAINEVNPLTGKTFLTPYKYYPHFVELNEEELEDYEKVSKRISRQYAISKNNSEKNELLQRLLEKRQKIVMNCSGKYIEFNEIISKTQKELMYCLVYCSEKQINEIQNRLKKKLITNHTFTGKEGTIPKDIYGGLSERSHILKKFGEKNPIYQVLVAMKCLDEGVDVPSAKSAIIMASSGNPKQYIQRRGRILRRSEGKEIAIINDILVVPSLTGEILDETKELERKILRNELKRYEEFAKISENYAENLNMIFPIKKKYGLI